MFCKKINKIDDGGGDGVEGGEIQEIISSKKRSSKLRDPIQSTLCCGYNLISYQVISIESKLNTSFIQYNVYTRIKQNKLKPNNGI